MHRQRTRYTLFALAVLVVLAGASPALAAVELEESFDRSFDLGSGGSVAVANVNGSVQVEAWDRDEVRVLAVKKVKAGSRSSAEEALEQVRVEIDRRGDRLEIETELPRRESGFFSWLVGNQVQANVRYEISVPRSTDVEIRTVNGKIRVEGVRGRVQADTTNGGIEMTGLRGSVRAGTVNGGIDVALVQVEDGRDMRLSTTNGGIDLRIPRDVRATIDAQTVNGGIGLEGIDADVSRRGRRHLNADLNGGGPEIRLSTTNGGIDIHGR